MHAHLEVHWLEIALLGIILLMLLMVRLWMASRGGLSLLCRQLCDSAKDAPLHNCEQNEWTGLEVGINAERKSRFTPQRDHTAFITVAQEQPKRSQRGDWTQHWVAADARRKCALQTLKRKLPSGGDQHWA